MGTYVKAMRCAAIGAASLLAVVPMASAKRPATAPAKPTKPSATKPAPAKPFLLRGTAGDDTLTGGDLRDKLWGYAGSDTLSGNAGNDQLRGGAGDDALDGGAGADRLWGGAGTDTYTGGAGDDRIYAGDADAVAEQIDCGEGTDFAVVGPEDTVIGCERVSVTEPAAPTA